MERTMALVDDPHWKHIYFVVGRDGEPEMVIQTDLAIDGLDTGYDPDALAALIDAAGEHMKQNPAIAKVRFEKVA